MKPIFAAPHAMLENKPPHGAPCNRCGLCCVATLCALGREVFGYERGPCPALRKTDDAWGCGLVIEPGRYRPASALQHGPEKLSAAAAVLIGSATGCDARFNGEAANEAFYEELRQHDIQTAEQTREARKTWRVE
jgi:hypothetical protein